MLGGKFRVDGGDLLTQSGRVRGASYSAVRAIGMATSSAEVASYSDKPRVGQPT